MLQTVMFAELKFCNPEPSSSSSNFTAASRRIMARQAPGSKAVMYPRRVVDSRGSRSTRQASGRVSAGPHGIGRHCFHDGFIIPDRSEFLEMRLPAVHIRWQQIGMP